MKLYEMQLSNEEKQVQDVKAFNMNLRVTNYYNKMARSWDIDIYDIDKDSYITQRKGLSTLSPALIERGLPFVVTLKPKDGKGNQPTSKEHLLNNFTVCFLTKKDFFDLI